MKAMHKRYRGKSFFILLFTFAFIAATSGYAFFAITRPVSALSPQLVIGSKIEGSQLVLTWPSQGQAAVGAVGYGVLASHGQQTAYPTASTIKLLTALTVMQKKPLFLGETGPNITLSAADAKLYTDFLAVGGSVIPVAAGQIITEHQGLEAMLLPSANNMAVTLAIWAYGNMDIFLSAANQLANNLGMTNTRVTDPSGLQPDTVSTARDLVLLGQAAMRQPVIAQIVSEKVAQFPGVGTIQNTNSLLGQDAIIGIKTGNSDEAGGCYIAAATHRLGDKDIVVITAVMGSSTRWQAMRNSVPLINSAKEGFVLATPVHKGEIVAHYTAPWGQVVAATAARDVQLVVWKSDTISIIPRLKRISTPVGPTTDAGVLLVQAGSMEQADTPVVITQAVAAPSVAWRLREALPFGN